MIRRYAFTFFLIMLNQLILAGRDILAAGIFGSSPELNHFLKLLILPNFCIGLISSISAAILIPIFIEKGHQVARPILKISLYLTLFLSISAVLIKEVFLEDRPTLVNDALYIVLGYAALTTLASLFKSHLNSVRKYYSVQIAGALGFSISIAWLYLLRKDPSELLMARAYLFGALMDFLICYAMTNSTDLLKKPLTMSEFQGAFLILSSKIRQTMALLGAALFAALNPLVAQSIASKMTNEALTLITFAQKLPNAAVGLIGTVLGSVYFTEMSQQKGEDSKVWRDLSYIFVLSLICAVLLYALSHPLVKLVFLRGQFGQDDLQSVVDLQRILALHLPGYLVGFAAAKILNSRFKNEVVLISTIVGFLVHSLSCFVLGNLWGIAGIAWSAVFLYTTVTLAMLTFIKKDTGIRPVS